MNRRLAATTALLGVCLLACGSDKSAATQIVITVDSNLKVPDDIDQATIDVTGLVQAQHVTADLSAKSGLPRKLTLVHDDGPLGPIRVTATGWIGSLKVVEYKTDVTFQMRETIALDILLDRECRNYFCDDDETCRASHCEPIEKPEPNQPDDAGETPEPDSGPMTMPDAGKTKDAGPMTTPPDAGKPDAGSVNQPPKCTITNPNDGESFTTTEMVPLEGSCTDPETGELADKLLRWNNGDGDALGLGPALSLPPLPIGAQTFKLCATDPKGLSGCDQVSITVMLPAQPTAKITKVADGNNKTESPFLPSATLSLTGKGTGEQITYAWMDTFVGDFGNDDMATLKKPEVGRHYVTLTVTDDVMQSAEDTTMFQVLAAGQTSLVDPFSNVNTTLSDGASVLAADSTGQVLAASGTELYRFDTGAPDNVTAVAAIANITLDTITAITIWEPANLVYLGTTSGLVVCNYTAGGTIDGTMCTTYQGMDLPSDEITSVARATIGSSDVLVVGTAEGLFVPDDVKGSATGVNDVFTGEPVTGILESGGVFWFTSEESGLFYYDTSLNRLHGAASPLDGPSLKLNSVAADDSGAIWVGSSKGAGRYDPDAKSWQVWATGDAPAPGLVSDKVAAVATTHVTLSGKPHDVAWIGTDSGISRLDADVPSFMTLDDADGLPSNEVLAMIVLQDGTKVISTSTGVALYTGR